MRFVPRKNPPHDVPEWVPDGAMFFITIQCAKRGEKQLTVPVIAEPLLESVAHYHGSLRWFARLFLLMPDHAHALLAFPQMEAMPKAIADWKRYTARQLGIAWQRGFFDHRLREGEQWQLKADYIRANPVRKGLAASPEEWPWVFTSEAP
jgi:REP element-mobilizing transposase RayT